MGYVSEIKSPYTNKEAIKTYSLLTYGLNWRYNVLYKVYNAYNVPIYLYINSKNYLHVLKLRRYSSDGDILIMDLHLTNKNTLTESNRNFGIYDSIAEAYAYLDSLVGKMV